VLAQLTRLLEKEKRKKKKETLPLLDSQLEKKDTSENDW